MLCFVDKAKSVEYVFSTASTPRWRYCQHGDCGGSMFGTAEDFKHCVRHKSTLAQESTVPSEDSWFRFWDGTRAWRFLAGGIKNSSSIIWHWLTTYRLSSCLMAHQHKQLLDSAKPNYVCTIIKVVWNKNLFVQKMAFIFVLVLPIRVRK